MTKTHNNSAAANGKADPLRCEYAQVLGSVKEKLAHIKMKHMGAEWVLSYGKEFEKGATNVEGVKSLLDGRSKQMTIIEVVMGKNSEITPHAHDRKEFVYVLEGMITDRWTGDSYSEGMCYEIPAERTHHIVSEAGALLIVVWKPKFE